MSGSNYPAGVTGREPQITGEWPCADCGATLPEEAECPNCRRPMIYDSRVGEWQCECGHTLPGDTCPGGCPEPDYDAIRDREDERRGDDERIY